jgi:hypothetical protein
VYSKRPFGGPEYVLQYLGRYTHRVAISDHRLVSFAEGTLTFRWRDSAHNNEQKLMTLSLDEFLRRSCCTCFRKVSCAFGASAFSPTAGAPRSCHFAFICSVQHHRQNRSFQAAKPQVIFGYAQIAVDP